ncbi:MAG: hypothetical protein TH68_03510 [Candidatus Synechococcus spongiarum 142]|uniref:Uncharacterized protein n=1 Tax=Candidatus Synechococcus spongiarum 142 TaxID=1608213 RepID=A0A6N3X5N6_9SYNE|nr:MAG: hypothetical protein TH68_03510 [Candidatus Synechococcus spongiarum 142]
MKQFKDLTITGPDEQLVALMEKSWILSSWCPLSQNKGTIPRLPNALLGLPLYRGQITTTLAAL